MRSSLCLIPAMLFCLLIQVNAASAQEIDCLKCHAKMKKEKVVHAAIDMGCPSCHAGIDASKVPHKKTSAFDRGLSAAQPDLCYGCHDKALFSKKTVHAAVGMGCTGCHNPHSSKNAKLLVAEAPDLCLTCHDKAAFNRKNVHAPVAGGMCLGCHSPHSTDDIALLLKKPAATCLECHPDVSKKPHAVAGLSSNRHPLGIPKPERKRSKQTPEQAPLKQPDEVKDPARPGKTFYCGSCHDPHSSDSPWLFRYKAKSSMELCVNCHKM